MPAQYAWVGRLESGECHGLESSALEAHNADPKPFVWIAGAGDILQKVRRARVALQPITT